MKFDFKKGLFFYLRIDSAERLHMTLGVFVLGRLVVRVGLAKLNQELKCEQSNQVFDFTSWTGTAFSAAKKDT